jgi:O-acetyl-ADP-ribose deacetylase (regulator of RNase III)
MRIHFVFGDLLKLRDVDAIIHQVNCLCVKAHGLSKQIAEKYPWGDIYSTRRAEGKTNLAVFEDRGIPGTTEIGSLPIHYVRILSVF